MASKSTKKALLMSVLSMILCVTMLMGTTFAWFTDSVTSANNVILAGNLDVELYHEVDGKDVPVDPQTPLFDDVTLWEPGAVTYENLTVANLGDLALKFRLSLNVTDENTVEGTSYKLTDVLKVAVVPNGVSGDRAAILAAADAAGWNGLASFTRSAELPENGDEITYGVVIYWEPTDNDNNYNVNNGKTTSDGEKALHVTLGVSLFATQLSYEDDAFDNTYDSGADSAFPKNLVVNGKSYESFDEAFANAIPDENGVVTFVFSGKVDFAKEMSYGISIPGATKYVFKGDGAASSMIDLSANYRNRVNFGEGVTIELYDLTIGGAHGTSNHQDSRNIWVSADNLLAVNCAFLDAGDVSEVKNAVFDNCTFITDPADGNVYAFWIGRHDPGYKSVTESVVIKNCYFEGPRAIKMAPADNAYTAVIENNTFVNLTAKPAICLNYGDQANTVTIKGNELINCPLGLVEDELTGKKPSYGNNNVYTEIHAGLWKDSGRSYLVYTPEAFVTLNETTFVGNNGGEAAITNVKLMGDIDLAGYDWTPIETMFVNLDGNGYTVSNLTVSGTNWRAGLFGYLGGGTVRNLTLENVNVSGSQAGTFAGSITGKIINCTLKGDNTVTYTATTETWGGVGAITGVVPEGSTVEVTIEEGATVTVDKSGLTTGAPYVDAFVGYINNADATVVNNGNVTVISSVSDTASLAAAIKAGANEVYLEAGEYELKGSQADGVKIIGSEEGVKVSNLTNFAGNGNYGAIWRNMYFENVIFTEKVYTMADGAQSAFKDCVFEQGFRRGYSRGVVFEGCTFYDNSEGYAMHFEEVYTTVTVKDCKFVEGTVAFGNGAGNRNPEAYVTFEGCTFSGETTRSVYFEAWASCSLTDCTFTKNSVVRLEQSDAGETVTFTRVTGATIYDVKNGVNL